MSESLPSLGEEKPETLYHVSELWIIYSFLECIKKCYYNIILDDKDIIFSFILIKSIVNILSRVLNIIGKHVVMLILHYHGINRNIL